MEQIIKTDYAQAVKAIKQAIVVCRYRAARQMNGEVLGLYYSIGKYISEQSRSAQWGTNAIQTISDQLQQELPGLKGFSEKNIRKMRQFYEEWCEVFEIHSAVPNEFNIVPQSLLCRDKDNAEVEFALRDISKPMGVATYRSVDELPDTYKALPSAEELRKLLKRENN